DTYRSDLKHRDAYTAYSNPRGFIYQNKDKKNKLMRIDELHKFSDGTLDDVTAQAAEIQSLKAQIKKLKKQARPFILHHKAWLRTVKRKNQHKKKVLKTSKRRSVFKQGRKTIKSSKGAPTVPTNTEWDDLDMDIDDTMDYTLAQDEGKTDNRPKKSTSLVAQTTPTTFGDDETIAQVLLNMSQAKAVSKEKEKGVEIRNAENAERPRTTSTRSVWLKNTKEWEAEEERKRLTEEEATKTALSNEYDFIQARIEADRLLAERVQEAEREQFTVEKRAKFLHILRAPQKEILHNKELIFDEIKALYEKVKRFDDSFITIGSTEDERKIKEMNEGASDLDNKKKFVKEDVSAKVPAKQDVVEQDTKKRKGCHMKMIARKRKSLQPDVDSDDEHRKCLKIITFEYSTQSKGYRVYNKRTRLIVESIHLGFDEIKEMSELDLLFGPLYDEFFNDGTSRVNKSSSPTDNSTQQDTPPTMNIHPTSEPSTPTNVHAEENNDNQAEFTNPFCTPVQENAESSSRNIGNDIQELDKKKSKNIQSRAREW
ncbi:hypothetical protein Tco_0996486, partial [Tanacetum coccineum]